MTYPLFQNLCKYYLDYIIEDNTDTLTAFVSGNRLSYMEINNPELSSRVNTVLNADELNNFRILHNNQVVGNQNKSWWYGYPTLVKFVTGRNNRQCGLVKPLFVFNLDITNNSPVLLPVNPRINNDAFKDLGLELEQIRDLAENLGLFNEENISFNLQNLSTKLCNLFSNIQISDLSDNNKFSDLPFINETKIYSKGIILATEASRITQGLEKELNQIKDVTIEQIGNSSLSSFFPSLKVNKLLVRELDISEAIELNEQQKETVRSAFNNKLTVVTGPPGTGKSQVVASIVINAARNGQRVLVASKNHKAVDVVESRLNQFAERPFIIRLGKKGTNDRNIQQELIQYLNSLLGIAPSNVINQNLMKVQNEIIQLFSQRKTLEFKINEYRKYRNDLSKYSMLWEDLIKHVGKDSAMQIFNKCSIETFSIFDKIKLLLFKNWKIINKYVKLLNSAHERTDLELLTFQLTKVELSIREKSKDEFTLWLNDLPARLDGNKRKKIAEYVSTLEQFISAGDNTSRQVWAKLYSNKDNLMRELTGFLPAWCVTNLSVRGQLPLIDGFFDLVVIDEASQCDIASSLPLLYRAKRAVIIGDPNQMTHISTLNTNRSIELMYSHSLSDSEYSVFEAIKNSLYRLSSSRLGDNKIIMLNEHFRSHKDIIDYSNKTWYKGELGIGTEYSRLNPIPNEQDPAIEWIDVYGVIQQVGGAGAYIVQEVNATVQTVINLVRDSNKSYSVGVVTPFRLQANKIREALVNEIEGEKWNKFDLIVDTAVKFQGDERDIMIFSPVIAQDMPRGIRYYHEKEYNLLNVAITRARAKLIVIGNFNASLNCGISYIENFAKYVKNLNSKKENTVMGSHFESPYEEILYNELLKKNIQTIPQYSYGQYRLDLAYINCNKKIDIEVDGVSYHTDWTGEIIKQDIIRNRNLQKKGWTVLRFWSYEIRDNIDYCIQKIIKSIS